MEGIPTFRPSDDDKIHNVPLSGSIRTTSLGRSYATTIDGREWTRHVRDKSKPNGGWTEFNSDVTTFPAWPVTKGDVLRKQEQDHKCELCVFRNDYGNEAEDGCLQLQLVIMMQSEGELKHWGLFVGRETGTGEMLQVSGDWLHMHFDFTVPETPINLFGSSPSFHIQRIYTMTSTLSPKQALDIRHIAKSVPPPQAATLKQIKGNCQTWCIDVLQKLQERGIVKRTKVVEAEKLREMVFSCDALNKNALPIKAMVGGGWTYITRDGHGEVDVT